VRAFGALLEERAAARLEEQEWKYLELIQQSTERMQAMLEGLLAYSRVTTGARPFEAVDMNRVASEVLSDLEVRLKETGGEVELGQLPVITADLVQMRQLLQNLIDNALKFHKPGAPPSVKVFSRPPENDCAALVVADNGIGFDPALAEQLFKPFHRLVGKSAFEGSGLGLAICQKIAERHGGAITAAGEPGGGATFTVTLPRRPKQS
jgi:light-regulated signal transduction histidine kinase (bacteriophytochrome)